VVLVVGQRLGEGALLDVGRALRVLDVAVGAEPMDVNAYME
jgi:hypothetical protein